MSARKPPIFELFMLILLYANVTHYQVDLNFNHFLGQSRQVFPLYQNLYFFLYFSSLP